jgi:trigger factor
MTSIQVEDISDVKKKVFFEIPSERVAEMLDAEYRDLKKTAQIKGFRKGKAPLNILRSYFKDKVQADASRKMIEETFRPGLEENKITLVSVIKIEPEALEADKPFKYWAEIEVTPPIEVKDYKGLKLKRHRHNVTETQVSRHLENLRERFARLSPLTEQRGASKGDHVLVDVRAVANGKEVRGLTVKDHYLELGRDFFLTGFDSRLEGVTEGQSKTFSMVMPEDFKGEDLADNSVDFTVMVKEVKERVLPALDDDFAKDLGTFETLEQLKESISEEMQSVLDNESRRDLERQIIDALIESHPFEPPESLVEGQIDMILDEARRYLVRLGRDQESIEPPTEAEREKARPTAVRSVKAALILKAVAEKEGIEVSDAEMAEGIEKRAEELGWSVDHLKDQLEAHNMLGEMRGELLQGKVIDLLKQHADITEEGSLTPE